MEKQIYNSKIDWWITAVILFTVAISFIGPLIDGESYMIGAIMAFLLLSLEIGMFASVKYQIKERKLGIRNGLYRWDWYPVDQIKDLKKTRSILTAPALSFNRIAIRFTDKKILKSSLPLEISPKDRDNFIATLKEINPKITILK